MEITKKEIFSFILLWFLGSIAFLCITGVMYNGFFFGDYQQYLVIQDDLQYHSILGTVWNAIKKDLVWRWRPLFILQYCVGAIILHNNWLIIHLLLTIIWTLDATLLYCAAREFNISKLYSTLYVGTCLIGAQIQLLDDLCVAGAICLLPICLCIYMLSKYNASCATKHVIGINISLFILLFALEDYVIYIPFLVATYIFLYGEKNNCTLWTSIKKNIIMIIAWMLGCAGAAYYVLTQSAFSLTGTSKSGNLQLGAGVSFGGWGYTLVNTIRHMHTSMVVLCVMVPLALLVKQIYMHKISINKLLFSLAIMGAVASEIIIHSQRGIAGRYWLPMLIPIASVICIIFPREFNNKIINIIVVLLLAWNLLRCVTDANVTSIGYRNSFLSENELTTYIDGEILTDKIIWLEFGGSNNISEMGLQMLLDQKGYSNVYFSGQNNKLIDMYNEKTYGNEYANGETICQLYGELYEFFGYYPEKYKTIDSSNADVIICTSAGLDKVYEIIDKEYLVDNYAEFCVSSYIVYEK